MQKILFVSILSMACYFGHAQGKVTLQCDTLFASLPGRQLVLNSQGFPQQVIFQTDTGKTDLLAENIHFHFTRAADGKDIKLQSGQLEFSERKKGHSQWTAVSTSDELTMMVSGKMDAKGEIEYTVKVTALQDVDLKDMPMHIPFQPDIAKEMSGLGVKMGPRPDSLVRWQWNGQSTMGLIWIGTPQVSLRYVLKGSAWDNDGKGGIVIGIKGKSMLANNYTGARTLHKGDVLSYSFLLYLGNL